MREPGRHPAQRLQVALKQLVELFANLWLALLSMSSPGRRRGGPHPWRLRVGRKDSSRALLPSELEKLVRRHRDLKDIEKIAGVASHYRTPESDFFSDAFQVERLIRRLIDENPPWLYVSRTLAGGEQGGGAHSQEFVWREQVTTEVQDVTLFVPEFSWRDTPLASLTMRPTRHLEEVWQARLLDQVLPPEVMLDRHIRGEIQIPVRNSIRQRMEFRPEARRMEVTTIKRVPIPIDTESGSGKGGQLLYFMLDYSASMRGKSAALAMAVIAATLRANMGQRETRYLFRRYADEMWPPVVEPPIIASSLEEKDRLLDTIMSTNFNGSATHVNDALDVAVADITSLRRSENLDAAMLLVTDGLAEVLESTRLKLLKAGVKIHAVMVTPERNPGIEKISESFTALDIGIDQSARAEAAAAAPAALHRKIV